MVNPVLYHTVIGRGEPLILLHGLFGMGDNLIGIAKYLSEYFTVYCLDLRNHGHSFSADSMRFEEMATDVLVFMDSHQIPKAHLLGHSLGGKVAMQLALMSAERVMRLVVADIAPVAYGGNHDEVFSAFNALDLDGLMSRSDAEAILRPYIQEQDVRLFILKSLARNKAGKFSWLLNIDSIEKNYNDLRTGLVSEQAFTGSTLFIKGELSSYIQAGHRDMIETLFPQSQFKIIQNVGHWLHIEKPVTFNNLVKQFLTVG